VNLALISLAIFLTPLTLPFLFESEAIAERDLVIAETKRAIAERERAEAK
jgi:hypothetical protein